MPLPRYAAASADVSSVRVPGWHPSVGLYCHSLRMSSRCVGRELNDLLLIGIRQPSLATELLRGIMLGAILARHEVNSGEHGYLCWGRIPHRKAPSIGGVV